MTELVQISEAAAKLLITAFRGVGSDMSPDEELATMKGCAVDYNLNPKVAIGWTAEHGGQFFLFTNSWSKL